MAATAEPVGLSENNRDGFVIILFKLRFDVEWLNMPFIYNVIRDSFYFISFKPYREKS